MCSPRAGNASRARAFPLGPSPLSLRVDQLRVTAAAGPLLAGGRAEPWRSNIRVSNRTSKGRPVAVGGPLAVALAMRGLVTLAPPCRKHASPSGSERRWICDEKCEPRPSDLGSAKAGSGIPHPLSHVDG